MRSYTHPEIGAEIHSISGYYTYLEEIRLNVGKREVLCTVGVGIIDNSCCGQGGCCFIEVPGYLVSWKNSSDADGHAISTVIPVENEAEKKEIKAELQKLYPQTQVNFI